VADTPHFQTKSENSEKHPTERKAFTGTRSSGAALPKMQVENTQVEKNLRNRKQDFTLFAFLEGLAGRDGIKGQIEFMRPSVKSLGDMHQEEQVEMRLQGVSLDRLIPYLYHIEAAPEQVRIRRLTIRPQQRDKSQLEVSLVVVTRKLLKAPQVMGSKKA
jgi:hypothetical protein